MGREYSGYYFMDTVVENVVECIIGRREDTSVPQRVDKVTKQQFCASLIVQMIPAYLLTQDEIQQSTESNIKHGYYQYNQCI